MSPASQSSSLSSYYCNAYADHIPSVDGVNAATAHLPWSSRQQARRAKGIGCLPQQHAGDQYAMSLSIVLLPNDPTFSTSLAVAVLNAAWRHDGERAANWIASWCKRKQYQYHLAHASLHWNFFISKIFWCMLREWGGSPPSNFSYR